MTKNFKLVLALVLSIMMILSMVPAMAAAAAQSSITINNAVKDHTYTAYQILKGDVADGKLSNVDWGTGITDAGKTALYTKYGLDGTAGKEMTAQKVADAIAASSTNGAATADDSKAIEFANTVGTNVQAGTAVNCTADGTIKIDDLADGYYMIVDSWTGAHTAVEGTDYSIGRYMVQLVGTAVVNNKADKPTVEKKIVEGSNEVDDSTENIGDTVNYIVKSKVPEYDGYKEYYMDFTDVLSKGLTYVDTTVAAEGATPAKVTGVTVKIGGHYLTADDFTVTVNASKVKYNSEDASAAADATQISIHLKDFVSRHNASVTENESDSSKPVIYNVGDAIEITYAATVNDSAVIGNAGNPNKVKLEYSNKPLQSGDGTPDNNNDGVKGNTPWDEVKSYVTEIDLTKVIKDSENGLPGAVFNVMGSQINRVIITGEHYVEDNSNGTFYLLTDNTYTEKVPTEATKGSYANLTSGNLPVTKKYKKEAYTTSSVQETAGTEFQVISDTNGKVKITGLKEGTYTITEVQAPAGYNKLQNPIKIVVTSNIDAVVAGNDSEFKWKVNQSSNENATVAVEMDGQTPTEFAKDGTYQFKVENAAGTTLPSTGGIGTTIFYVAGSLMVLAAAILLITKRRMGAND